MGIEQGEKKFRADQIWEWLYRKRVQSFEEMTNLSKDLIAKLNDQFVVNPLETTYCARVCWWYSQISLWIAWRYVNWDCTHASTLWFICLCDHQVGCNIGCTFCASGLIKKQRDLNNGEIVAQIMLVQKYFADEGVQVNLAVSLHAPNNELRSSIMKINRAFPIENSLLLLNTTLRQQTVV